MPINIFDPVRNYHIHKDEFDTIFNKILNEGRYINGPEVKQIEEELSKFTGSKYSIGVSSGTDALLLALMALDIGEDDEVITTPFTWISTAEVIPFLKAKPVFVDIDPNSFNIDVNKIEDKITDKTKAILPVSLFGRMCEIDKIMDIAKKHNLFVIEDAAQSLGSKYKNIKSCSMADISCTSFYPTKSLGCFGDGGACFTNDEALYEKIKALKDHGCLERHKHEYIGINGRLDTLQAGVLLVKLKFLDSDLEKRRLNASKYNDVFKTLNNVTSPDFTDDDYHIYSQYTIKLKTREQRDDLLFTLKKNNINVSVFYPVSVHNQKCFQYLNYKHDDFPISNNIGDVVISLPVYPELREDELSTIIDVTTEWDKNN